MANNSENRPTGPIPEGLGFMSNVEEGNSNPVAHWPGKEPENTVVAPGGGTPITPSSVTIATPDGEILYSREKVREAVAIYEAIFGRGMMVNDGGTLVRECPGKAVQEGTLAGLPKLPPRDLFRTPG